jgi:hypothetical protein
VDIDDPELAEYPDLAAAVAERMRLPMVQVGDQVKHPSGISIYWIEAQLASLGLEPFAAPVVSQATAEEGN